MKALKLSGITLPGAGYPQLNDFLYVPPPILPVSTGLAGLYTAGYSDTSTLRNYADATKPLTKVGAPVVTAGQIGAVTSRDAHYNTGLFSTADLTFMVVAKLLKATSSTNGWLGLSNFNALANSGSDSLGFGFPNGTGAGAQVSAASGPTTIVTTGTLVSSGNVGEWNVIFGRIKNDGSSKVWWSHAGVVAASAETAGTGRFLQAGVSLRIGGHVNVASGLFTAANSILAAGVFTGALSDADIAANLAYLSSTWGPSLGIGTL